MDSHRTKTEVAGILRLHYVLKWETGIREEPVFLFSST
jgi:hypothetical protein